jgi:hypothetical protein
MDVVFVPKQRKTTSIHICAEKRFTNIKLMTFNKSKLY